MDLTAIVRLTMAVIGIGTVIVAVAALFEGWSRTRVKGRRPTLTVTVETGERITLSEFHGTREELESINRAVEDIAAQHRSSRYSMLWGGLGAVVGGLAALVIDGVLLITNLSSGFWSAVLSNAWVAFLAAGAVIGGLVGRWLGRRKDEARDSSLPSRLGSG